MIIERDKLPVLQNTIHSMCEEMGRENPDITLYVFGSLGRRFALVGEDITLDDYIHAATTDDRLMPRKNYRGNTDIDIGISESDMPWAKYSSIARKISLNNPSVEIDPHFLSVSENSIELIGVGGNEYPIKNTPNPLDVRIGTVTVDEQIIKLHPFSLQNQLEIMRDHGKPQYKNFMEIARIIAQQKDVDMMKTYPEVMWIFMKYFTTVDWKQMSLFETTQLLWRSITSETIRRKLSQIRGKAKDIYNYNEVSPVYL